MVGEILASFLSEHKLSTRELAGLLTETLSQRRFPPHSISHSTIANWIHNQHMPNPELLDYLSQHTPDLAIRQLCEQMIAELLHSVT